ncbi:DJ-1/PfpI family protein [Peptoniphilus mikwangii]|uniref:DJ-1/PfpI family protein n=1 Tax=Peptoniphilus mikwangii TaxID=1354300 RepID=UPI0003F92880|nr:DJ-1/PfpI family protein [Peptoniphilus mikwangii]
MKKTAVLIYDSFCNFEFSVALESLSLSGKQITVFSKTKEPIQSEEGLIMQAEKTIYELNIDEFDSLLLTGATDIRNTIEDESIIEFIKNFDGKIIGAISIAPILLLKAGMLNEKSFMAGVNKEDLLEEGFDETDLSNMVGWNDNLQNPVVDGYIIDDNIITSVSYNFVKFGLAFSKMLGLNISSKTFGM